MIFMFGQSDCSGKLTIGYEDMMKGVGIASRNTLVKHLHAIRELGWFDYVKRRGWKPNTFFLCIPDRYQQFRPRKNIVYLKWKSAKQ
jgi:tRNA(Phe) wybutosine-synthesizing methylase Tyw3